MNAKLFVSHLANGEQSGVAAQRLEDAWDPRTTRTGPVPNRFVIAIADANRAQQIHSPLLRFGFT